MNLIKIIKRGNLRLPLGGRETEAKKGDAPIAERKMAQAVGDWIGPWREQKPKDARRAFAELFQRPGSGDCPA